MTAAVVKIVGKEPWGKDKLARWHMMSAKTAEQDLIKDVGIKSTCEVLFLMDEIIFRTSLG